MTSSSGTNRCAPGRGTQRGRIFGTLTRANRSSPLSSRSTTASEMHRLRDVREGMARVHRQRREDRKDVGVRNTRRGGPDPPRVRSILDDDELDAMGRRAPGSRHPGGSGVLALELPAPSR